jgi:anti-anti-sigma regulatory factor
MDGLTMEVRQVGDGTVAVFRVTGEIDLDTGEALRTRVTEAARQGPRVGADR